MYTFRTYFLRIVHTQTNVIICVYFILCDVGLSVSHIIIASCYTVLINFTNENLNFVEMYCSGWVCVHRLYRLL